MSELKQLVYRREIMERFMDKRQQAEFDKQYQESKTISLGQKKIKELDSTKK